MRIPSDVMLRLWRDLPCDGQGLRAPRDADIAILRLAAARRFWQRTLPRWTHGFVIPVARLTAAVAILIRTIRFARRRTLTFTVTARLLDDCLASGAPPSEALIWRQFVAPEPHPLPYRAAAILLPTIGDPADHRLLADKLATAEMLTAVGIATPPLLERIRPGSAPDPAARHWREPGRLFVKPRFGSASRGAHAVTVLPQGRVRIDDGPPIDLDAVARRIASTDEILVQPHLTACAELDFLGDDDRPPVLRLTTARRPRDAAFLHSALLSIPVPGANPRNFANGHVHVPVDPVAGRLRSGLIFARPGERLSRLPWHCAPFADRQLPCFDAACRLVLVAMARIPGLPLANWDVALTPEGPIVLEGNSSGNWILTCLPEAAGLSSTPLPPLLRAWYEDSAEGHETRG